MKPWILQFHETASRAEAVKWILALAIAIVIWRGESIAPSRVAMLSICHLFGMALFGTFILAACCRTLPPSLMDRLTLSFLTGWCFLPLLILPVALAGYGALAPSFLLLGALGYFIRRWKLRRQDADRGCSASAEPEIRIPWPVYGIAFLFTALSVALPFSHFSEHCIVREFYGDGVQRLGTAYALAQHIPPQNPFMAGAPFRYYWFYLFPFAVEARWLPVALLDIWKCGQTWMAFLTLPGLWLITRILFRNSTVAWSMLLFGFVFASYECLLPSNLSRFIQIFDPAVSAGQTLPAACYHTLIARDPDMLIGLIKPYSDQLFMEDFLYVPQNAIALIIIMVSLWLLEGGNPLAGIFTLSSLAGVNTFYIIPTAGALGILLAVRRPFCPALMHALAWLAWSVAWLSLCNILPQSLLPVLLSVSILTSLLVYRDSIRRIVPAGLDSSVPSRAIQIGALFLLGALLVAASLHPVRNPLMFLLNYGPGFALGVALIAHAALGKRDKLCRRGRETFLFVAVFGGMVLMIAWFLSLQYTSQTPALIREWSTMLGERINLFNFYHKTAKLMRLGWAVFAGLALVCWGERLCAWTGKSVIVKAAAGLLLIGAVLTSILRPLTYLTCRPVPEQAAGDYLAHQPNQALPMVLLEDFRFSRIHLLSPVLTFYYSTWTNGQPGLTQANGAWIDQYLPRSFRAESQRRKAINIRFFAPDTGSEERKAMLKQEGISYLLTRTPWDFHEFSERVVTHPGGYLYRVVNTGDSQPGAMDHRKSE